MAPARIFCEGAPASPWMTTPRGTQRCSTLRYASTPEQGAHTLGEVAAVLADAEALEAHGLSAQKRMRGGD